MGSNKKRGTLSESERLEIIELYESGDHTYQSLADQFDVNKSTISRIINKQQKKLNRITKSEESKQKTPPPSTQSSSTVVSDPLLFREIKLMEIAQDIESTRERGSHHALPQFHRLHLQVYDEWVSIKKEMDEIDGLTNPEEVLHTIAIAVKQLPPVLRDRLQDMLDGHFDNVIPLYGGGSGE